METEPDEACSSPTMSRICCGWSKFRLEREGYEVLTTIDGEAASRSPAPSGPTCACST